MDIIQEKKVGKFTVKVVIDDMPINPRTEWENFGNMICFHKRYNLGDDHNFSIEETIDLSNDKNIVCLPLYLYDHSGITISTSEFSCSWDSGQVGFIYVTKQEIRDNFQVKNVTTKIIDRTIEVLKAEVKEYDCYLTGQVYAFIVTDENDIKVDSCYGFIGDDEECLKEGIYSAEYFIRQKIKNHTEKVKKYIKNKIPLIYRQACPI